MSGNGFEYANLKLVRGSQGGLFLTYFHPYEEPTELKLIPDCSFSKTTGLGQALAQMGVSGWEVVSKASNDVYFLKRIIAEDRPIDRPVLIGFELNPVIEEEPVQANTQRDEEKDYNARVQAARMGISIGDDG